MQRGTHLGVVLKPSDARPTYGRRVDVPEDLPPSRCTPSPKGWTQTTTPLTRMPSSSLGPVSGGCEWKHHTSFAML